MDDVDIDVDISEPVQTHPRAVSENEKGMDVPVSVDGDFDPIAKGVAT